MSKVRITWKKSLIGAKKNHHATIEALGLRRLNHTVVKENTPQIKGMIANVIHLVEVEEIQD
ncbi:MAG: 50S ribosomal protein L30 [Sumerlaeia bacterium]